MQTMTKAERRKAHLYPWLQGLAFIAALVVLLAIAGDHGLIAQLVG